MFCGAFLYAAVLVSVGFFFYFGTHQNRRLYCSYFFGLFDLPWVGGAVSRIIRFVFAGAYLLN
jgi:hypothetical protein